MLDMSEASEVCEVCGKSVKPPRRITCSKRCSMRLMAEFYRKLDLMLPGADKE